MLSTLARGPSLASLVLQTKAETSALKRQMPGRGHWAQPPLQGGHGHEEVQRSTETRVREAVGTSPALFPVGMHAIRHLFLKTSVTRHESHLP